MADLSFDFTAMASACELRLAGADEAALHAAAQAAIGEVRRIEQAYTRYRPDSIVSRINAAAGTGQAIEVDAETAHLLAFAAQLHAASDGRFDITSGVLRRAWDFRQPRLPEPAALAALLPLIGWGMVAWDGRSIALPKAGMELDFGGFGKEYAADRAHSVLASSGVSSGYVNLGGDIRVLGPQAGGRPWRFAIRHPRAEGQAVAHIELGDGALATSGDYERFIDVEGRRYCHILDARCGWPVTAWQSVSVVAPVCVAAGALSTMAMLQDATALEFLRGQRVGFFAVDAGGASFHEGV
jgi:FAD:protein FMN transferase